MNDGPDDEIPSLLRRLSALLLLSLEIQYVEFLEEVVTDAHPVGGGVPSVWAFFTGTRG